MPPVNAAGRYKQNAAERFVAIFVAVAIIALAGYLIVRNEPFADPNLVVVTRVILSLAVAVLGATIPGFLNIGWNVKGVVVRAGGALALFLLTFWFTPGVLPALKDSTIPPLKNAKKISRSATTDQSSILRLVADSAPKSIEIRAVYEGDGERQRKFYDVLISNSTHEQRLLTSFKVKWLYAKGRAASVEQGTSIKPVERYSLLISVDPDKANQLFEKSIDVYPPLILPPRGSGGPSVTSIRLEVFYTFEGARINWHPNADWDIFYEVDVQDDTGASERVMFRSWRHGAAYQWPAAVRAPAKEPSGLSSPLQRPALFYMERGINNALFSVAHAEKVDEAQDSTKYLIANQEKISVVSVGWDEKKKAPTSFTSADGKNLSVGYLIFVDGKGAESILAVLRTAASFEALPESDRLPISRVSLAIQASFKGPMEFLNGEFWP
jgi:hypothetical protein